MYTRQQIQRMSKEDAEATRNTTVIDLWNDIQGMRKGKHCPVLGGHIGGGNTETCRVCTGRISR